MLEPLKFDGISTNRDDHGQSAQVIWKFFAVRVAFLFLISIAAVY